MLNIMVLDEHLYGGNFPPTTGNCFIAVTAQTSNNAHATGALCTSKLSVQFLFSTKNWYYYCLRKFFMQSS